MSPAAPRPNRSGRWSLARQTLRGLVARPVFAITAVATLGLSLGLASAVLALLFTVFVRPVTVAKDPDRVAIVFASIPGQGHRTWDASVPELRALGERSPAFAVVSPYAAFRGLSTGGEGAEPAERIETTFCEASYFAIQGARARLGRLFTPDETAAGADRAVLVLTADFWRRRFGGREDAIGSTIRLNDREFTVIGVLEDGFRSGGELRQRIEAFAPLPMGRLVYGPSFETDRGQRIFQAVAQLAPGVTMAAGQAEADRVAGELQRELPDQQGIYGLTLLPVRRHFFEPVFDLALALAAGVGFVLLIGCVNLGHLFAVQAEGRRRELAVRSALGARPADLTRLCLAEIGWLTVAGGALALGIGSVLVEVFNRVGALRLPTFARISLTPEVMAATIALLLVAAAVTALAPLRRATAVGSADALAMTDRAGGTRGATRRRHALIALEVAAAVVLLVGAGLTVRTLLAIDRTPYGFEPTGLLTGAVELGSRRYPDAPARAEAWREIHRILQHLPGTDAAALWGPRVPGFATFNVPTTPEGLDPNDRGSVFMTRRLQTVPGGLATLGIPLLEGRDFDPGATLDSPLQLIVGANYVRRFWPDGRGVGRTITLGSGADRITARVIGVAADAKHLGRAFDETQVIGDVYFNQWQAPYPFASLAIRYRGETAPVLAEVRRRLSSFDPGLVLTDVATAADRMARREGPQRLSASLFSVYGAIATLLTGLGVFGVLAFAVGQRRREIGVRLAIGARPGQVVGRMMSEVSGWIALGLGVGLAAAAALAGLIRGLLFEVSPRDPAVFAIVAGGLLGVGLLAAWLPAWRAARMNPVSTLRVDG